MIKTTQEFTSMAEVSLIISGVVLIITAVCMFVIEKRRMEEHKQFATLLINLNKSLLKTFEKGKEDEENNINPNGHANNPVWDPSTDPEVQP